MSFESLMRADALADFLQVDRSRIQAWTSEGRLSVIERTDEGAVGHPLYTYSAIDALLRENPTRPTALAALPPLSEQLTLQYVLGQPALMTRAQAAQWLEISLTALDRALTEDLASIRLAIGGALRIPLGAVIDYADSRKGEGAVTAKFAGKMLGVSNKKISEISSGTDNLLSRQHVPGSHGELYIVTDSLLSLIARHVASGTAEDWWRLRCKYGFEPLLTLEAVRKEHHVHERTINRAIYLGELPCLFLPGTTKLIRRIPKHAAEQWTMAREAMAPSDLAQMLGASVEAVQKWNRQRVLCRTAHRGRLKAMTCPSLNCIYQYLLAKQINRFDPWIWITNRQTNKTPLYSFSPSKGVQTTLEREVWTDIHAGRLYAVTLPDGQIVVMGAR